jgi:hypothetical protein
MKTSVWLLLPLLVVLSGSTVLAQGGGGYDLSWSTIAGGGAIKSTGGSFGLGSTIGQPAAHLLSGGAFNVQGGFWGAQASPLGSFTLSPSPASASVSTGQPLTYTLVWTVPSPLVWRSLDTLQLRIHDNQNTVIWARAHIDSVTLINDFSLIDPATGIPGPSFPAGSPNKLETQWATLDVANSTMTGSGPTGQLVTVVYALSFKPLAAGRIVNVDVLATDVSGNSQGFDPAGTLLIQPRVYLPRLAVPQRGPVGP